VLPPSTGNANSLPASAGERSKSLVGTPLIAGPQLANETAKVTRTIIAVTDST